MSAMQVDVWAFDANGTAVAGPLGCRERDEGVVLAVALRLVEGVSEVEVECDEAKTVTRWSAPLWEKRTERRDSPRAGGLAGD